MFEIFIVFLTALLVGLTSKSFVASIVVFFLGTVFIIAMRTQKHRQVIQETSRKEMADFKARMVTKKNEIRRRSQAPKPRFNHLDVLGVQEAKPFIPAAIDADTEDTQPFIRQEKKSRDQTIPFGIPQRKDSTVPYTTTRPVSENDSFMDPLNPMSPLSPINPIYHSQSYYSESSSTQAHHDNHYSSYDSGSSYDSSSSSSCDTSSFDGGSCGSND